MPFPYVAGTILTAALLNELVPVFVRKTADETVTSSTVLQNDDHLFVSVAANSVYVGRLVSHWGGDDAGGAKTAFTVPAGCTVVTGQHSKLAAATGASTTGDGNWRSFTDTGSPTSELQHGIVDTNFVTSTVEITLITGANAGIIRVQWAQIASAATGTVHRAGSFLLLQKVA